MMMNVGREVCTAQCASMASMWRLKAINSKTDDFPPDQFLVPLQASKAWRRGIPGKTGPVGAQQLLELVRQRRVACSGLQAGWVHPERGGAELPGGPC